ncbi:diaminopimelate epimerase [Wolbachia pipientis]|uniref:Diaminopimelate epimerase n=1 Tax=Wolbachia pipientis TaxID=955 RepID=A0A1E7QK32_WOLPI|nr:diaminopimelate epimerase [Wolbachia pipientis]OEY86716.1 diaminopimelate epimerase [Wolbachia pipientis]
MFIKMHGIGNNFAILDLRLLQWDCGKIAGCKDYDQIIVITSSGVADCFMHVYNSDGSKAEICGNAARCVGYLMMLEKDDEYITIELMNGRILECFKVDDKSIKVNMGKPLFKWHEIPLSVECNTLYLPIGCQGLKDPAAINIANPHMIFFVEDIDAVHLQNLAPQLENHPLFPNRTNVSFAKIEKSGEVILKVWERGTGVTSACGSAACAAFVASVLRGYITNQQTFIHLPGGKLLIEWEDDVFMTGDVDFLE